MDINCADCKKNINITEEFLCDDCVSRRMKSLGDEPLPKCKICQKELRDEEEFAEVVFNKGEEYEGDIFCSEGCWENYLKKEVMK